MHNSYSAATCAAVEWERFARKTLLTSAMACGLDCAPCPELTTSSDCAPSRCELQYGTTPSELLGVSPRPRSPVIEWKGIPGVIGSLLTARTKRLFGSSVLTLLGMRLNVTALGSCTKSGFISA